MNKLVLDIETIKDDSMVPFIPEKKPSDKKEPWEKVQFDSNYNKICCISLFDGTFEKKDETKDVIIELPVAKHFGLSEFDFDEKKLLDAFWMYVVNVEKFITFNGLEFDIPYLYKRSLLQRSQPSVWISLKKYYVENHIDVRAILGNWSTSASGNLDLYCKIMLGKSCKNNMDGSEVQKYWNEKRYEEIYKYCDNDCIYLWEIYQKMMGYYSGIF